MKSCHLLSSGTWTRVLLLGLLLHLPGCFCQNFWSQQLNHLKFLNHPRTGFCEVPGRPKFLTCSASGLPFPRYAWTKDGSPVNESMVSTDLGTFKIGRLQKSDEGLYRCVATNSHGSLVSLSTKLRVAYFDTPADPRSQVTSTGGTLECSTSQGRGIILDHPRVDSLPSAVMQWSEGIAESETETRFGHSRHFRLIDSRHPFYHVTSDGQLIVLDVKEEDEGKLFNVTAVNPILPGAAGLTWVYKLIVHKEVQESNFEIIYPPKDVVVVINGPSDVATFECVANARPITSISTTWYFKPSLLSDNDEDDDSTQEVKLEDGRKYMLTRYNRLLKVLKLQESDAGTYRCQVVYQLQSSFADPVLTEAAELKFQVAPRIRHSSAAVRIINVDHGDNANFSCDPEGLPMPLTTWYFNARILNFFEITNLFLTSDNTLQLHRAAKRNSGYYQCFASNAAGEAFLNYYVNVTAISPEIVTMSPTTELIVIRGTNLRLSCTASGIPKPQVVWYQVNHLTNATRVIGGAVQTTNEAEVAIETTSTFMCEASNEEGQVRRSAHVRAAVPTRLLSPTPLNNNYTTTYSISLGSNLTLHCLVSFDSLFYPHSTVIWYKNGHLLRKEDSSVADTTIDGSEKDSFTESLDLRHHDRVEFLEEVAKSSGLDDDDKLKRLLSGVSEEDDLRLSLDRPDSSGDGLVVVKSQVVMVAVTREDGGNYECRVESPGGGGGFLTHVQVMEPPDRPRNVNAKLVTFPDSIYWTIIIQWEAGFHGNSPIKEHLIFVHVTENLDPSTDAKPSWILLARVDVLSSSSPSSVMTYSFQGKPSHSYAFCVSSINEVGESQWSDATKTLMVPEEAPSGQPLNVSGRTQSEHSISLSWQPPEKSKWNGPLQGYTVKYRQFSEFKGKQDENYVTINVPDPKFIINADLKIDDLQPFTSHEISVAAYNMIGIGPYSDPIVVQTAEGVPMIAPGHVTATSLNSTSLNVTFKIYDLEKFQGRIRGCKITAEKSFNTSMESTSKHQRTVTVPMEMSQTSTSLSSYNSPPTYWFPISDLEKFTWYLVSVACYNSKGQGPFSRKVKVQTDEDVPDPVTSLKLDNVTDESFNVVWSPPVSTNGILTGYVVRHWMENKSEVLVDRWLEPSQTSYAIGPTEFERTYVIQVAASSRKGVGSPAQMTFKTGAPPEFPEPPSDIFVERATSDSILLTLKRKQKTFTRWQVELSRGPDPDTFRSLPEEYLSHLFVDDSGIIEVDSNNNSDGNSFATLANAVASMFSPWSPPLEFKSFTESETTITLDSLSPFSIYRLRIWGRNSRGSSKMKVLKVPLETGGASPELDARGFCGVVSLGFERNGVGTGDSEEEVAVKWMPIPRQSWNSGDAGRFYRIKSHLCEVRSSSLRANYSFSDYYRSRLTTRCVHSRLTSGTDASQYPKVFNASWGDSVSILVGLKSCSCHQFEIAMCNKFGCSSGIQLVSQTGMKNSTAKIKDDRSVSQLHLISLDPSRLLATWNFTAPQNGGKNNGDSCRAFKVIYWKESPEHGRTKDRSKRSQKGLFPSDPAGRLTSNASKFKIVSKDDKYVILDDLEPGTSYAVAIATIDDVTDLSSHRGDQYQRQGYFAGPVYAATLRESVHDRSASSFSSQGGVGDATTKNWMIIIASVVAGLVVVIITFAAVYVCVKRNQLEKAKNSKVINSSLNSMTYDPLESTNQKRGQSPKRKSSWKMLKGKHGDPAVLYCAKAPPRPSPGSILYDNNNDQEDKKRSIKFISGLDDDDDDDDKSYDETTALDKSEDDEDVPPLPPPPASPHPLYDPSAFFGDTLTRLPDPGSSSGNAGSQPSNQFSTLPVNVNYYTDDFVVNYHHHPYNDGSMGHNYPLSHPYHPHQQHPSHYPPAQHQLHSNPAYSQGHHHHHVQQQQQHGYQIDPSLPPPPPQTLMLHPQDHHHQQQELWLHGQFQNHLGNPVTARHYTESETRPVGGGGGGEVRCMTIGRRYKSSKIAPYV